MEINDVVKSEVASNLLSDLNDKQRECVLAPPTGGLQIIAGPGTGKTKVLVSRVAYLITVHNIDPSNIIVTTFTKKAANEMLERLGLILGNVGVDCSKLLIGTFHSICYRLLRRYGHKIGLGGYTVADESDAALILKDLEHDLSSEEVEQLNKSSKRYLDITKNDAKGTLDSKKLRSHISKLKSDGIDSESYASRDDRNLVLSQIYTKYQEQLKTNHLLDFDDCLLHCYHLVQQHPVLNFVEHVLVDEFQDTNDLQLSLVFEFARGNPKSTDPCENITVVGDPDQSIYGFRNARYVNFSKMKQHYEVRNLQDHIKVIALNKNYRSTKDILEISEIIMRQQHNRIQKYLTSNFDHSFSPIYASLDSAIQEARWISLQIQALLSLPDKLIKYQDIAILVRSASQTRCLENEFLRNRIPYIIVKGRAFWTRKEVTSIMDYLKVISTKYSKISYLKTLNYPKRGLGEKTLKHMDNLLESKLAKGESDVSMILQDIASGNNKLLRLPAKASNELSKYLRFLELARDKLDVIDDHYQKGVDLTKLLEELFDFVYSESGLKKEFDGDTNQKQNIEEVKKQLLEFRPQEDSLRMFDGATSNDIAEECSNFLQDFILSMGLNEQSLDDQNSQSVDGKVSVSTIHGSKGLEWPVVFVPGLSEGILPSKFCLQSDQEDSVEEERRCLYVATTRAKALLYMSSYIDNYESETHFRSPIQDKSRFIKNIPFDVGRVPFENWWSLKKLYQIMNLSCPLQSKFDLDEFYSTYEDRLKSLYDKENKYLSSSESRIPNFEDRGFTSAKLKIENDTGSPKQKESNIHQSISATIKKNKTNTRGGPTIDFALRLVGENKMRKAIPSTATRPDNTESIACGGNKVKKPNANYAPPYIPVRKVPSLFLNRRRKLGTIHPTKRTE